jgi:predicted nucleic acid-binding protein
VTAADASVAIAAFSSWHPQHQQARSALGGDATIVGHAAYETYAVLTRLPHPYRASSATVLEFIARRFPDPYLALSGEAMRSTLMMFDDQQIVGGTTYDALIAATAAAHGATLVSLDQRAVLAYERAGADYRLVS